MYKEENATESSELSKGAVVAEFYFLKYFHIKKYARISRTVLSEMFAFNFRCLIIVTNLGGVLRLQRQHLLVTFLHRLPFLFPVVIYHLLCYCYVLSK